MKFSLQLYPHSCELTSLSLSLFIKAISRLISLLRSYPPVFVNYALINFTPDTHYFCFAYNLFYYMFLFRSCLFPITSQKLVFRLCLYCFKDVFYCVLPVPQDVCFNILPELVLYQNSMFYCTCMKKINVQFLYFPAVIFLVK